MYTLNCKGRLLRLDIPAVMGIINITPDSFYAGSRHRHTDDVVQQAGAMLAAGARLLDIGGQSTRPGAERVDARTEAERVVPAIAAVHQAFPDAILSVDTFYAEVAQQAVEAGAALVNDVSAGLLDDAMLPTVAALRVPYVCMHMQGTPHTMQQQPRYDDVTRTVLDFLIARLAACRQAGITDIIADPGVGFGKTPAHNFQLLRNLQVFHALEVPLLLGVSRKATVYKTLGITAAEALNGTTVLHTIGLLQGAHILRVHDVQEAVEAVTLVRAMQQA